jgi:phosphoribosylaminoimidazolecarboxamide formyltransferase/IMP cyclohydrolase
MHALLSVSDKQGLVDFARRLAAAGIKLISTGGTAKELLAAGIDVLEVSAYTGFPEMLDGRVKTLHPKLYAGILGRRDVPAHASAMKAHGVELIDLVVVNLYPFRETIAKPGATAEQAIENIDIGGPAMIRAAAKNWQHVGVVVDPADYEEVIAELEANDNALSAGSRFALASKAFAHTASYDDSIAKWFGAHGADGEAMFPPHLNLHVEKMLDLRYGENPHQQAALYRDERPEPGSIATFRLLQGKALSYNNLADADAAWECVKHLADPAADAACVIVKHANPCGAALASTPLEAYRKALATDPVSAFGGIIAFNRMVDAATVEAACEKFIEVLIAPGYSDDALEVIARKPNVRVLEMDAGERGASGAWDWKRIGGGFLLQAADHDAVEGAALKAVTQKKPTPVEMADLVFAWRVARFVKSNAIVYCGGGRTLGIGAGQMSRVDSTRLAAMKAHDAGLSLGGSVVASDAFFPFRDGLDVVADNGAVAVIQPGGSVRDDEVIKAADERGIAMVFTGIRHFRH